MAVSEARGPEVAYQCVSQSDGTHPVVSVDTMQVAYRQSDSTLCDREQSHDLQSATITKHDKKQAVLVADSDGDYRSVAQK